jgi:DNA-directed RNA polymerase alpha subunit
MTVKRSDQSESDFPARLSQPALRALSGAGIKNLKQLSKFSESEIKKLHGMGPNGINQLRVALAAKGLSFADKKKSKD